jgi:hypothetical protein
LLSITLIVLSNGLTCHLLKRYETGTSEVRQ